MAPTLRNLFILLNVFAASSAWGQFGFGSAATDGLTATGSVDLSIRPEFLLMTVQVEGRSSDLPEAARELTKRIEAARKKLTKLDAVMDHLTVSKPQLQGTSSPKAAQKMQMMMQQYGGGARGRQMLEATKSVSIHQTITVRWPLSGDDDLERLINTHELTERIKAADVASAGNQQPVSDAQAELAEEMSAMMDEYGNYNDEQTKTGEPTFTYIAVISSQQYSDAVSDAFKKAKQ